MSRLALILLVVVAAGCHVAATGVLVTVDGPGLAPDQLQVVATVDGTALAPQLVPAAAHPLSLPVSFFAELPDGTASATFDVTALAAGAAIAHGVSPPTPVGTHQEPAVTVTLTPAASDGGVTICGAGAQPTACATGSYAFCDSFESESGTSFGAWSGSAVANAGGGAANAGTSISVQRGAPVCAGSHSLHAVAMGSGQQAFVYQSGVSLPSTTHLRAFVYLPSSGTGNASADLFAFATNDISKYLQLGYDAGTGKLFVYRNFGPEIDFPTTLPLDRWLCLELALTFDPTAGAIDLSIDGTSLGMQTGLTTVPSGSTFSSFEAGLVFTTASAELYLDEIVLSATPVGCQ